MSVRIIINEQVTLEMRNEDMYDFLMQVIPAFFRDSSVEAPDPVSDLIRGSLKSLAVMPTGYGKPNLLKSLLFSIYGADAPVFNKRDDKLPIIWRALADFAIKNMEKNRVAIFTETAAPGVERVIRITAKPIHTGAASADAPKEPAELTESV
jgi:hypothetical protein